MIPVNIPLIHKSDSELIAQCLSEGWISSEGPYIKEFEEKFGRYIGKTEAIAVSNGTAALEIAIRSLSLPKGSEIIIPSFTIISCAQSITNLGLIPVLVDSDPQTWNMDINLVLSKITPKTRAIMAVHIYGLPVDLDPLISLCKTHSLILIEDAAQAHGLEYKGKKCGSFGDISVFSFYPNKIITTGEGGMILTNNSSFAAKAREYRNLCFQPQRRFVHEEIGYNYRMTSMQAALGISQLSHIEEHIKIKRNIGKIYREKFLNCKLIQMAPDQTTYANNIYWVFGLVLSSDVKFDADFAQQKLNSMGIGTRPFFWPMHEQPVFKKMGLFASEKHPIAEKIARRGFYLPSGLGNSVSDIEKSADCLLKVLGE